MKTKLTYILTMFFITGMTISTYASTPNKPKDAKTTSEQLTPPPYWTATVRILDADSSCYAQQNCNITIHFEAAGTNCMPVLTWETTLPYVPGKSIYSPNNIPSEYPCVYIWLSSDNCSPSQYNSNTCCACQSSPSCNLEVCPKD